MKNTYIGDTNHALVCLKLEDARLECKLKYTLDFKKIVEKPEYKDLIDNVVGMKICRFVDKYVSRVYGTRAISAWLTKNKGKTIFDLITMSDIAYTVAVIENGHEKWDEAIDPSLRVQDELPKTSKFTKKAGLKREFNSAGWTKDGIDYYNKVWEGWKKLSGENYKGIWKTQVEDMWFEYVEQMGENQGRKKRNKSNPEDDDSNPPMPNLPVLEAAEMLFEGDEGYQPDRPWKNSESADYYGGHELLIDDALDGDSVIEGWQGGDERESLAVVTNFGARHRVSLDSEEPV